MLKNNFKQLDFKHLDLSECNLNTINIIGKRHSGKTTLAKELMNYITVTYNIQKTVIFTPSDDYEHDVDNDNVTISNSYTTEQLNNILDNQRANRTSRLLIFDDCLYDINSSVINELLKNGRHYNLYVIIVSQFPLKFL